MPRSTSLSPQCGCAKRLLISGNRRSASKEPGLELFGHTDAEAPLRLGTVARELGLFEAQEGYRALEEGFNPNELAMAILKRPDSP